MSRAVPPRFFLVRALLNEDYVDNHDVYEPHEFRVVATSKTDAERRLRECFLSEHDHALCRRAKRLHLGMDHGHTGMDRVVRGKTKEIRVALPKLGDIEHHGEDCCR